MSCIHRKNLLPAMILTGLVCLSCNREPGEPYSMVRGLPEYSGDSLRNIFYPLGGIGTGNILLGGRGNILEFEIFNRAQRDELPPYMTFFSLWCRKNGEEPDARVLERRYLNDFDNGFGVPRQQLSGLPRFSEVTWSGAPPLIALELEEPDLPLGIRMEAFNPMIPLEVEASSFPAGEISWIITNRGKEEVDFSVAFIVSNPFKNLNYRDRKPQHPTLTEMLDTDGATGVYMANLLEPDHQDYGSMVVATDHWQASVHTGLVADRWWDDAHILWEDFREDGRVTVQTFPVVHEGAGEVVSVIQAGGSLAPGAQDTVRFYIVWHVPNRVLENSQAFGEASITGVKTRNYYARTWGNAKEAFGDYMERRTELVELSSRFSSDLMESTVPPFIKDAVASNLAILKSNLISRVENGDLHGFEGLGPDFGCCPGNCTHVWNYEQTLASLFPALERNMRETAFYTQTYSSGYQSFRTTFPIGNHHFPAVAADGQMGNIMHVYREWKYSGDSTWLAGLWPAVGRAMEYAWNGPDRNSTEGAWVRDYHPWDPLQRGVLEGTQHNTYDVNFYGPNIFTGTLYLGALKACAEMAGYLGDPGKEKYAKVYSKGLSAYDSLLWNGMWWIQQVEEGHERYQFGEGCLSDQLLGQYLAFNSGLGYILDSARVKTCLETIYANNFIPDFSEFHNVQRVYALNNEGGLVLCSWPDGNRERIPFPYADEVWTGVEYQVAASLIRAGMVDEGLEIAKAVRNRYSGYNRNPYAEIESGFYYARALASWSLLDALSGYTYDGVEHSMTFNPANGEPEYTTFWSCGTGWGIYRQTGGEVVLLVDHGSLELNRLTLPRIREQILRAELNGQEVIFTREEGTGAMTFSRTLVLGTKGKLTLYLSEYHKER